MLLHNSTNLLHSTWPMKVMVW